MPISEKAHFNMINRKHKIPSLIISKENNHTAYGKKNSAIPKTEDY